jgi:hypothetical protein
VLVGWACVALQTRHSKNEKAEAGIHTASLRLGLPALPGGAVAPQSLGPETLPACGSGCCGTGPAVQHNSSGLMKCWQATLSQPADARTRYTK